MGQKKRDGYMKSENVIWVAAIALVIGFVGGVAFGIYKSGPVVTSPATEAAAQNVERQQAIDELIARTQQNPDDLAAWTQLGHLYFDSERSADAIKAYEKALALNPENADLWTDLGVMYRRDGAPRKAIEAFDRAINLDPNHQIARFDKGIVLFYDLHDEKGALAAWESLLAINPAAKAPGGQTVQSLVDHIKNSHKDEK